MDKVSGMDRRRAFLIALVTVALGACSIQPLVEDDDGATAPRPKSSVDLKQGSSNASSDSQITETIKKVLPAVVNVRVKTGNPDPFSGEEQSGEGSGVVIDPAGIILTNNHVIEGAREVTVVFNDDREAMTGEVVGAVPERDLAVVKVDADDLTAIELGTSDDLELGTSVIAIGFPLGLGGPTVTQGIISGLERTITVEGSDPSSPVTFEGLLQTDAAINPGNSGGALIDNSGRLVGVNSAAAQPGSAENIGFAIAIDAAVPAVEAILGPEQAWLGVSLAPIESASTAAQAGFDSDARGALIVELLPQGPADDANVPINTLIVEVAGRKVDEFDDVTEILADLSPGDEVQIKLLFSDGDTETVELKLEARPKDQLRAPG